MGSIRRFFISIFLFKTIIINVSAQVKSPNDFLPHRLGTQFTPHHLLVKYFEETARVCPKTVKLEQFGTTFEGRPQILAVISSPENMERLEEIRKNHLDFALNSRKNDQKIAIVWLGYSVHGNEAAGSEASMQVFYELATQSRPEIREWVKNTIVLIDPSQNPDGYDRYTHWVRGVGNLFPEPNILSREHVEPWPRGRPNHYHFDLNRDWAWLTQTESQARIAKYHTWLPHIYADVHEQFFENPYYFAPAAEPFHEVITPFQRQFQTEIGQNHAKYFDENGWLFFTREQFDLLYPSYGDTYPTYNGAIGMTYEQGGIRAGRAVFLENGDTLTLGDRILHHATTSFSTIEIASKNAERLVENFQKYFETAQKSPRGRWKSFVLKSKTEDEYSIEQLVNLLEKHQIRVGFAGQSGNFRGFSYQNGREENFNLNKNDLVISCFQPHGDLAIALLEPETRLSDSVTYDITAWSLPLAFGLEAYALSTRLDPKEKYAHCQFSPIGTETGATGFLVRWQDSRGPKFLAECLKNGLNVRRTGEEMTVENQVFAPGTLLLTRADNADLGDFFDKMVSKSGISAEIDVFPAKSGFVTRGQDFGSSGQKLIVRPTVALMFSDDCDANSFGHIWWHFERELGFPIIAIPKKQVERGELDGISTLIFAEDSEISDIENLKSWVKKGGKLILVGSSVGNFAGRSGFEIAKKSAAESPKRPEPHDYNTISRENMANAVFGAIVENRADPTNPLAFGLGRQYFSLKTNGENFNFLEKNMAVWVSEKYTKYGFIGSNLQSNIKKSMTAGTQNLGKGSIVYLVDPPLFRGFWAKGKLLFDNAVFF